MVNGERNSNLFKFAMSLNDFGISQITASNHLLKYAEKDFNGNEIQDLVNSAYKRGKNTFSTKFFEDSNTKSHIQKQILSGKRIEQIKTNLERESNPHEIETIEKLRNQWRLMTFGMLVIRVKFP